MYAVLLGGFPLLRTPFWDSHPGSQLTHFAFQGPGTGPGWCGIGLEFKHNLGLWIFFSGCLRMPVGLEARGHGQGGSAGDETDSKP